MHKYAALFAGQGSQYPGMATELVNHPIGIEIFERANEALGFDIKKMCVQGDAEQLKLTINAQPSIYTVSFILYQIFLSETKLKPEVAAGHSLGEYTALAAAEVFTFEEGVRAVRKRGEVMQTAVPVGVGAMAAVLGADTQELENYCSEVSSELSPEKVVPANFNCSGQTVISGHKKAVEKILTKFKGKVLEVSAPFHSPLMAPAAEEMKEVLDNINFQNAIFPIISNCDSKFRTEAESFKNSLITQITDPVYWDTGILEIKNNYDLDVFIEFAPESVLTGLMRRIDKSLKVAPFKITDNPHTLISQ